MYLTCLDAAALVTKTVNELSKTVNINSDKIQYFDLGDVQGISELTLNGSIPKYLASS